MYNFNMHHTVNMVSAIKLMHISGNLRVCVLSPVKCCYTSKIPVSRVCGDYLKIEQNIGNIVLVGIWPGLYKKCIKSGKSKVQESKVRGLV
jgi:hypothetical protein